MFQERILHTVSKFYTRNKDNRAKLKKIRSLTAKVRRLRIPLYKNLFDTTHFRSYFVVLERMIPLCSPKVVFEWGPGLNTELFSRNGIRVYSVEHHKDWYEFYIKNKPEHATVIHSEIREDSFLEYPKEILKVKEHVDLSFVDARCRAECIEYSKQKGVPVVVMHDSLHYDTMQAATDGAPPVSNEHKLCKEGYHFYTYFVEVVDLRTIILMDSEDTYKKTVAKFSDFYTVHGLTADYDKMVRHV